MKRWFTPFQIIMVGVLFIGAAGVNAAPISQQIISKQEALARAQAIKKGRVLSIKLRNKPPSPPVYRVKILQHGDMHLLNIDARRFPSRQ